MSPPGHPLYVTYAVVMTLLYAAGAVYGYFVMQGDVALPERYSSEYHWLGGFIALSVGGALALLYFVGVVAPKRPWGWVYKLILICIGLTSCWLWPVTIPLLRRWLKPDMKRYYRMR